MLLTKALAPHLHCHLPAGWGRIQQSSELYHDLPISSKLTQLGKYFISKSRHMLPYNIYTYKVYLYIDHQNYVVDWLEALL